MAHRISRWEIEAAIEAAQLARADARRDDPAWRLVEATDGLGGMVWQHQSPTERAAIDGQREDQHA